MKLRVKFRKYGAVRFIGHLDVMRFFQKAIRRAEIDVAYTSGFSPHQIMSFAAPLGVGMESNGEYMDIEVNQTLSSHEMVRRLNEVNVPGIEVVSVRQLPEEAGNAMASVAAASYTVRFRAGREPSCRYTEELSSFLEQEQILMIKETKKGSREVDLKPGIFKLTALDGAICMLVDASSSGNIKPSLLIQALLQYHGEPLKENALDQCLGDCLITREEMYQNAAENSPERWISLEDAGFDIVGTEIAGSDTAGSDTTGSDMAGSDTTGNDIAGSKTIGSDTAGNDTAGSETVESKMEAADHEP